MNNNQNQEPAFYQKHGWWIWILTGLLILCLFFRNLEFKNPFFNTEVKRDTAIINAINNNGDKIVGAINDNGKKIGGKIDTTNNISREILDTLKEIKKDTKKISEKKCCRERKPCVEKPRKPKCPCPPVVRKPPSVPEKPKCDTCIVAKPKVQCYCILGKKFYIFTGEITSVNIQKYSLVKVPSGETRPELAGKYFVPADKYDNN
jgi:hypothetical protein